MQYKWAWLCFDEHRETMQKYYLTSTTRAWISLSSRDTHLPDFFIFLLQVFPEMMVGLFLAIAFYTQLLQRRKRDSQKLYVQGKIVVNMCLRLLLPQLKFNLLINKETTWEPHTFWLDMKVILGYLIMTNLKSISKLLLGFCKLTINRSTR